MEITLKEISKMMKNQKAFITLRVVTYIEGNSKIIKWKAKANLNIKMATSLKVISKMMKRSLARFITKMEIIIMGNLIRIKRQKDS